MITFRVKNFERFQHYKDRTPPWIKLYNELLDDYEFGLLPDASKWHLLAIWLLASRSENRIPFDPAWVSRRINASTEVDLVSLAKAGFIVTDQPLPIVEQDASKPLAKCLSREREEGEGETDKKKDAPAAPKSPEVRYFERIREVLGKDGGGLGVKLLASKSKSYALAMAAIETASTKQDPREYVGAIIRGQTPVERYVDPRL